MSITSDDFRVTSSNPSGATIATDYVNDTHIQEVKINTGIANADTLLSDDAPLPVRYTKSASMPYVPVAGSTDGNTAVFVTLTGGASLDVSSVTVTAATVDKLVGGASADIRSVTTSCTFGVKPSHGGVTFAITGDVKILPSDNNIGNVDVLTVAIPQGSGFTSAGITAHDENRTLPARTFQTGFRITNFGEETIYIGNTFNAEALTMDTGLTTCSGYPLLKFNSLFIEATGSDGILVATITGTADVRIVGS
tara:strand:- start:2059 stop:2814 length:756 start_codon:yes stop_codon:yes gene_type:complete